MASKLREVIKENRTHIPRDFTDWIKGTDFLWHKIKKYLHFRNHHLWFFTGIGFFQFLTVTKMSSYHPCTNCYTSEYFSNRKVHWNYSSTTNRLKLYQIVVAELPHPSFVQQLAASALVKQYTLFSRFHHGYLQLYICHTTRKIIFILHTWNYTRILYCFLFQELVKIKGLHSQISKLAEQWT